MNESDRLLHLYRCVRDPGVRPEMRAIYLWAMFDETGRYGISPIPLKAILCPRMRAVYHMDEETAGQMVRLFN